MKALRRVAGRALPLDRENVDTDQIIPAHWLKQIGRTGYGAGLFEAWRAEPAFVLNDTRYAGARILIGGANFGSGSSREHAAWALQEAGFDAVIAPRVGDIFRTNALKNGLVPVELRADEVMRLMRAVQERPALEIAIDVADLTVRADAIGFAAAFALDAGARSRLMEGLDEISLTIKHDAEIAAYEARRPAWLPRIAVDIAQGG